jgi:hypothetical protein
LNKICFKNNKFSKLFFQFQIHIEALKNSFKKDFGQIYDIKKLTLEFNGQTSSSEGKKPWYAKKVIRSF